MEDTESGELREGRRVKVVNSDTYRDRRKKEEQHRTEQKKIVEQTKHTRMRVEQRSWG